MAPAQNADLVPIDTEIAQLLDYLGSRTGVDPDEVAALEWRYLLLTGSLRRPARVLPSRLAHSQGLFVDMVAMARSSAAAGDAPAEDQAPTAAQAQLASLAGVLLLTWCEVAGQSPDGPRLTDWVTSTRRLLADRGLRNPGDFHIGRMLQRLSDPDGTVPGREARQLIEEAHSKDLENGIQHAFLLSGLTAVPDDAQASTHPRTRRVLLEVARCLQQFRRRSDEMTQLSEDPAP